MSGEIKSRISNTLMLLVMARLYPSAPVYSNSLPGIKAISVKGENVENWLSSYLYLYANLGNLNSNKGSSCSRLTSKPCSPVGKSSPTLCSSHLACISDITLITFTLAWNALLKLSSGSAISKSKKSPEI